MIAHYALKTSGVYTLVTVDKDAGECSVERVDGNGRESFPGTDAYAIQCAATHIAGKGYKTLDDLNRAAKKEGQHVTRRTDLDCTYPQQEPS